MKILSPQGIKLVLKEGTTFDVYFKDGKVKRYDILWLAKKFPQLEALKDRELFLQGHLCGWSGVEWSDELDIGTETVYEDGVDVTLEYDDVWIAQLGYSIKERRIQKNLTQQQLAEKVGIDQSDLSKIEKGLANPSVKMLKRISEGLGKELVIKVK